MTNIKRLNMAKIVEEWVGRVISELDESNTFWVRMYCVTHEEPDEQYPEEYDAEFDPVTLGITSFEDIKLGRTFKLNYFEGEPVNGIPPFEFKFDPPLVFTPEQIEDAMRKGEELSKALAKYDTTSTIEIDL